MRIGYTYDGEPITAEELQAAGAMAALLMEAIKPNLVQTLEGAGAFVHCGPFANIAHGASSVLADLMALKLADYVVTEAGFGADCGAEKFFNVKCRSAGLQCDASVIVASVRALKMHGGAYECRPGRPLPEDEIAREDLDALAKGCENLEKHIENMHQFGVPAVVAVNRFSTDTEAELELVAELAAKAGADAVAVSNAWAEGGAGATDLAEAVVEAAQKPNDFQPLYPLDIPTKDKIEAIATKIYGADGVHYYPAAEARIQQFNEEGIDDLPICIAKTQYSLSHDSSLMGRPSGFTVPVLDIRLSRGAGFFYALLGDISTLPALPSKPAAHGIDVDEQGRIVGLF
jgi:formyltetrahydrofolate synthetase